MEEQGGDSVEEPQEGRERKGKERICCYREGYHVSIGNTAFLEAISA